MDSRVGGANGSNNRKSSKRERPSYQRLSSKQVEILEKSMQECPHPDESQRLQLAAKVGIEPKQIKFWFQNKRTQLKNQYEKEDNNALRIENENIRNENMKIRELLRNKLCQHCRENEDQYMQTLLLENAMLKAKLNILNGIPSYLGNQISADEASAILSSIIER